MPCLTSFVESKIVPLVWLQITFTAHLLYQYWAVHFTLWELVLACI
jgi:hypothetical protein